MNDTDVQKIAEAFRAILGENAAGDRVVLIKRIPIICQDILQIKADLQWIKWLTMGIGAGIGALLIGIMVALLAAK